MLRFLYAALSKRSSDLSMDQGETANVERPFAAGHLQNTVGLGNERGEKQQTFHLVHFVWYLVKSDERPQVSQGDTYFARDTYPNSVRDHPSVHFHLMEQVFRQISARNHENMAHLP